jgi:hypothetical protein
MSTKQVGRAAVDTRKLRFVMNVNIDPIVGYVVGMDDYHWLVAHQPSSPPPSIALVHKGSTSYVDFTNTFLESEDDAFQSFARKVGESFWNGLAQKESETV